jgi:hypothetical protein
VLKARVRFLTNVPTIISVRFTRAAFGKEKTRGNLP